MRRDRSASEDRGRALNPVWDNPGSQLPGTGLGAGFESGLYGTSRRRDHSIPERTRLRTSQSEGVSTGKMDLQLCPVQELTDLLFSVVIL